MVSCWNERKEGKIMRSIEERLQAYGRSAMDRPDESKVRMTVKSAAQCFYEAAEQRSMSYFEFIHEQAGYIRKRWWVLQFMILFLAGVLLREENVWLVQRSMGILASLFVIMVVPELWKSRSSHSLEIEGAAYFSIRQIYAARMLIFGVVDGILLAVFTGAVSLTATVGIMDIVIQFFLPMIVTSCICFQTLCSRYCASEYAACFLSLLWTAVWMLLVWDDEVYLVISAPVWLGICCVFLLYLTYLVNKVMRECGKVWEKGYFE